MDGSLSFDLKTLEVFVAIVDCGGMTAAGQRLGITQSAVSQALSSLETNVATRLLDRSFRPPQLTPNGRLLYQRAVLLLSEAQRLDRELKHQDTRRISHLNMAIVDSLATSIGPALLQQVQKRCDSWSLITGVSHSHAERLLTRDIDLMISDHPVDGHPELERHPIIEEPYVLLIPKRYKGPITLKALSASLDFVRYNPNTVIGQRIEAILTRAGVAPPHRLSLDNSFAIAGMVRAGIGWTISTPLCLLQCGLFDECLQCLPLPHSHVSRTLALVCRQNELGELPSLLAHDAVNLLQEKYLPPLLDRMPWLLSHIQLGEHQSIYP